MSAHFTNLVSSLFGRFANRAFPTVIQKAVNSAYVKLMGLDMRGFEDPGSYPTLNALFTRELKVRRKFDINPSVAISPCDSLITATGAIEEGTAYQIKGMSYDTASLLGEAMEGTDSLDGGSYANFYLSPKDYHRYHAPFDIKISKAVHIPGRLYPVNMPLLKRKTGLFIENERVVLRVEDANGHIHFMVMVGALNVGKMSFVFDERIQTNASAQERSIYDYDGTVSLSKGELMGWFEMGSTVVMLSEADSLEYDLRDGARIAYGDRIGVLRS
jgi:phosphatidylserine decarboxylase